MITKCTYMSFCNHLISKCTADLVLHLFYDWLDFVLSLVLSLGLEQCLEHCLDGLTSSDQP